jgi:hypothetical protein
MRWPLITLLSVACLDPGTVELQGVVVDGWQLGAQPAAGVLVRSLDEDGVEVDRTTTSDGGWYRVDALAGGRSFVVVDGDDLVPASFSGVSGLNPRLRIPNGQVFAVSSERWAAEAAAWEGCPGLGVGGAVFGEVNVLDVTTGGSEPFRVETARLSLLTAGGVELAACYLNDEGTYDPAAGETGPLARFMVAGVPAGRHSLRLEWTPFEGFDESADYDVHVPEDGLAPRFPLFVTFSPES